MKNATLELIDELSGYAMYGARQIAETPDEEDKFVEATKHQIKRIIKYIETKDSEMRVLQIRYEELRDKYEFAVNELDGIREISGNYHTELCKHNLKMSMCKNQLAKKIYPIQ